MYHVKDIMEFQRGQLTAVAIIIALMQQGMGGFLLNQKDVSVTNTNFDYITDVYGAFHGSGQDIPVDFNPRENITGYYSYDPILEPSKYRSPQIQYNASNVPNNYPYTNQQRHYENYTVEITSHHPTTDWNRHDNYTVKITNVADPAKPVTVEWESKNDLTKYSGLDDHSPLLETYASRIFIEGTEHEHPHVINIQEILDHVSIIEAKDCTFTVRNGGTYPCFVGNLDVHDEGELGVRWKTYTYDERSNRALANSSTSNFVIHNRIFSLNQGWLVFGNQGDRTITIDLTTSEPDITNMYIDPNAGVSPSSQGGSAVESHEVPYYTKSLNIHMNFKRDEGQIINDWSTIFNVKYSVDALDESGNLKTYYLLELWVKRGGWHTPYPDITYWDHECRVYSLNQDGIRIQEVQYYHGSAGNPQYDINVSVSGNICRFESPDGNNDLTIQGIPQEHRIEKTNIQIYDFSEDSCWGHIEVTSNEYPSDFKYGFDVHGNQTRNYNMWFTREEPITIQFENYTTYWYNGYNNSTVGMVISSGLTRFNIKIHNPDVTSDYWIYDDVNKQSIYVNTIAGNMMVVGYVKADGTLDETNRIMIGAVNHVYLEIVCDQNKNIHLYQSPIYDFTNFTNYTLITPIDVTAAIQPMLDQENVKSKSISEIGYYNGGHWEGEGDNKRWVAEYMPRQLVVKTIILLDAGGLYIQDGELDLKTQFPQYTISEFIVNAVVHPGDSMSLISGGNTLVTIGNDGVDKWIYHQPGKTQTQTYDWWDLKVFYVQSAEGLYVNGQYFDGNHVYIQQGKWGSYDDWGQLDDGNLTIRMDGVWAFSTQYYNGSTSTTHGIEFADPGTWHWSKDEFMVVFTGVLLLAQAILYYTKGYSLLDLLVFGGQIGIIWTIF